jgi:phospholipid/cholesterol/gamma-HCH transport system ATP-binding protein
VVNAQDRAQLYRLRRRMGLLFQFGALFTDLDVFDNVAFRCASTPTCPRT